MPRLPGPAHDLAARPGRLPRSSRWAAETRARRAAGRWPSWAASGRVRELARERVADLAGGDLELLEGQVCAAAAAAEYTSPAPRAAAVAFTVGR